MSSSVTSKSVTINVNRIVAFYNYLAQSECVNVVFLYCQFTCGLFLSKTPL